MPARIVIVHDNPEFTQDLAQHLGPDVAVFDDPLRAFDLLKRASTIKFLVTKVTFGDRQPLGLSLARVTRSARPDVRIIFAGEPEHRQVARGLGEFLAEPISASEIGMVIEWLRGDALVMLTRTLPNDRT
jgi:hypothetical protein